MENREWQDIYFWMDNWIFHTNIIDVIHIPPIQVDNNLHLAEFILPGKIWDIEKFHSLLPHHIVTTIKGICLSNSNISDTSICRVPPPMVLLSQVRYLASL